MLGTKIEWATDSLNFWWGCTKVSPACAHCYAEGIAKIFARDRTTWGPAGKRWLRFDAAMRDLLKIIRRARRTGERPRVFVNSMSDTFEANDVLNVTRCLALLLMSETR